MHGVFVCLSELKLYCCNAWLASFCCKINLKMYIVNKIVLGKLLNQTIDSYKVLSKEVKYSKSIMSINFIHMAIRFSAIILK